ncbi:MAG: hypothetical protein LBG23_01475 [Endomicrobium sp.]|jgi:hypothetical protein|nr:hypothetical protein [Endomicrobium sp.]
MDIKSFKTKESAEGEIDLSKELIPKMALEKDKRELFFDRKTSNLALETSIPTK